MQRLLCVTVMVDLFEATQASLLFLQQQSNAFALDSLQQIQEH
jgi:hypothetical protein